MADYQNEIVSRGAPRWAWEIIDETLAMDARSSAFSEELRRSIKLATHAMTLACEEANDCPIDRKELE